MVGLIVVVVAQVVWVFWCRCFGGAAAVLVIVVVTVGVAVGRRVNRGWLWHLSSSRDR